MPWTIALAAAAATIGPEASPAWTAFMAAHEIALGAQVIDHGRAFHEEAVEDRIQGQGSEAHEFEWAAPEAIWSAPRPRGLVRWPRLLISVGRPRRRFRLPHRQD